MHEGRVVVFAGGGTGGHLYPALAIADALRCRRPDVRVVFIGATRGIEARVLPELGEEHFLLPVRGLDRGLRGAFWRTIPALAPSLLEAARVMRRLQPSAVVITGGYACAPAGVIAALTGVPLLIQEQNAVPGIVTKALSRFAKKIHTAFEGAAEGLPLGVRNKVCLTGNPVRPKGLGRRLQARALFQLPEESFVVLIVGGSQGSEALNQLLLTALDAVAARSLDRPDHLHILWSTGPRYHEAMQAALDELGNPDWVHPSPYFDNMPDILAAADLTVGRAGAMFTAELLNQGLPGILVPLPSAAADHQTHNARALAEAGAAVFTPESGLTGEILWAQLTRLAGDRVALERMAVAATSLARPEAADQIAASVERFVAS